MKQIIQDKFELKLYRVQAGFSYGLVNFDIGNRVDAAEGYREAIRIGAKIMKRTDKNISVISFTNGRDGTPVEHNTPMKEMVSEILGKCYRNLKQLWNDMKLEDFKHPHLRSNGTIMPESRKTYFFPHTNLSRMKEDDFHCLLAIGGSCCDCCKKKVSDTVILSSCAKCKMAFYCSKECQRKQWNLGHRKFCRKPGQFQEGDYVRLDGLESKPELNGMIVVVVRKLKDYESERWEVKCGDGGKSISVLVEKMKRLRPLDCLDANNS